ncbi:MAG: hypothetical protein D3924_18635, partial [Candidatus Electrothrix sp. AR4]|nr:hypothetical protein [Candidatus Electrothrix sp. AR4]
SSFVTSGNSLVAIFRIHLGVALLKNIFLSDTYGGYALIIRIQALSFSLTHEILKMIYPATASGMPMHNSRTPLLFLLLAAGIRTNIL